MITISSLASDTRTRCMFHFTILERNCFFQVMGRIAFAKALNGLVNIDISSYITFYSDEDRYSHGSFDNLSLKKN